MPTARELWTENELKLVLSLYFRTPFGKLHAKNPDVIELASRLGRTQNSVAYKLVNFASLDPYLQARGIKGASNVSKLDKKVWNDFTENFEDSVYLTESNHADAVSTRFDKWGDMDGTDKVASLKYRVNQSFFRKMILASYKNSCCITDLNIPELLVAAHISQWSSNRHNRLNPQNGLCLNLIHDKAYEIGLITISEDYRVIVSKKISEHYSSQIIEKLFLKYDNKEISLPTRALPDPVLLRKHHNERFQR